MWLGTPKCGPNPLSTINGNLTYDPEMPFGIDVQREAIYCHNKLKSLYDGCNRVCMRGRSELTMASQHEELEEIIYGKIFPVVIFSVVIANLTVAVVLSKKHMLSPTNVVLKYMAIADLFVGLVPLPWTLFYFTMGNNHHPERLKLWWCWLAKFSMDAIPPVFHNIAMWLTVLLAGQRYISISYPLHSRQLCSVRNVRVATLVITVISFLCGLPKSFDLNYDVHEGWIFTDRADWTYTRLCIVDHTEFFKFIGTNVYYNIYFWTRVIGFIIIPSILLIILNFLLIKGIRKAQKRKHRLLRLSSLGSKSFTTSNECERRPKEAQKQTDSNSTSLMLVVIVTIFLIVNLPQAFFMALLCVSSTFQIQVGLLEGMFPLLFLLVNNMLIMATYPINFGIYCFMSSSFRQTFKALFCKFRVVGTSVGQNTAIELSAAGSRLSHQEMSVTQKHGIQRFVILSPRISTLLSRTEVSQAYQNDRARKSDATMLMLLGPDGAESQDGSVPPSVKTSRGETIFL